MAPGFPVWVSGLAVVLVHINADSNTVVTVRHFKKPKSLSETTETVVHFKEPESQIEGDKLSAVKSLLEQAPPDEKRDVVAEINQMGKGLCKRNPNHPKCKDDTFKAKANEEVESTDQQEVKPEDKANKLKARKEQTTTVEPTTKEISKAETVEDKK